VTTNPNPAVTVVALCYNHERFLIECLESLRAQTFQDFQLIVTDDCSRDSSPQMIEAWLVEYRPDALFIRHEKNAGLCKTLNEALTHARGEFLSMIATDDVWEPDKIARQLEVMRKCPERVAVIYSDALQIDECGNRLPKQFIEDHRPWIEPPSGKIFTHLADGNFIPAMATLIRRRAIETVGGYDERLTYEDYDMWLRLSERYDFIFHPGIVARYRIVSTSIVRTVFIRPTANHSYTLFLICEKWFSSGLLNPTQRELWAEKLWTAAYSLYIHGDARARGCLWKSFAWTRRPRLLILALACSMGISRVTAKKLTSMLMKQPRGSKT
jgi:glycosyltransferase involved in cell wall biosynthesis